MNTTSASAHVAVCAAVLSFLQRGVKRAEGEFRNGNTAKSGVRRMGKNVLTAN